MGQHGHLRFLWKLLLKIVYCFLFLFFKNNFLNQKIHLTNLFIEILKKLLSKLIIFKNKFKVFLDVFVEYFEK